MKIRKSLSITAELWALIEAHKPQDQSTSSFICQIIRSYLEGEAICKDQSSQ